MEELNWAKGGELFVGVPSLALLPAKHYSFKVTEGEFKLELPIKGTYYDLDPEFFSEDDGEFDFTCDAFHVPSISKVLFATKKYPDLEPNQMFVPIAFIKTETTLDIYGQVIELVSVK